MADYKETAVTGTAWQRCDNVTISNPRNGTPTVHLSEQKIANVGDDEFTQTAQGIVFPFDPAMVIPLLNPATGDPLGSSMTGMEMYVALYSLYIMQAKARDAAAA